MATIKEQEMNYKNYINSHKNWVKHAFAEWGLPICDTLKVDQRLLWQAVEKHDDSKFSPEEFEGYRLHFYPAEDDKISKIEVANAFVKSWLHHCTTNAHHPEFWIEDKLDGLTAHDMSRIAIAEMILDWTAVGYMKDEDSPIEYWDTEGANKPLSDNTRELVNKVIDEVFRPLFDD